jgi:hypothetical protein
MKKKLIYIFNKIAQRYYFKNINRLSIYKQRLKIDSLSEKVNVEIVYDLLVSPPTYGDFIYTLMLCRYFLVKKFNLKFIIINSNFRSDWKNLEENGRSKEFVDSLFLLSNELTKEFLNVKVVLVKWTEYSETKINNFVLFKEDVLKRRSLYHKNFNLFSKLLQNENMVVVEKILLKSNSDKNLETLNKIGITSKYIVWPCRFNRFWGSERNLTKTEFIQIGRFLIENFTKYKILVLSDIEGCQHYKTISVENNLELNFSKPFTNSFIDDMNLLLNSSFVFQLRSGGIGMTAWFTKIPYLMFVPLANEEYFKKNKFVSWSTESQLFFNQSKLDNDFSFNPYLIYFDNILH